MRIILPAIDASFTLRTDVETAQFRVKYGLERESWLCVAGPYPHKNTERLIEAYASLRQRTGEGWPLLIRGNPAPAIVDQISRRGMNDMIRFVPWLEDEEMPLLYSSAAALIFPSLYEGGGLPVLEAMACGCPIVASDLPPTREFAGEAAMTFDPTDVSAISSALERCERSASERLRLRQIGLAGVERFSFAAVAASCLDAYAKAVR